jgi:U3 small nucleolar RNA-associated protein 21
MILFRSFFNFVVWQFSDFTAETTREKEWDNIACVHRHTTVATTWSFGHQKMGNLKLIHQR